VLYTGVVDRRAEGDPVAAIHVTHMDEMAQAIAGFSL
jgi:hypothetical protein